MPLCRYFLHRRLRQTSNHRPLVPPNVLRCHCYCRPIDVILILPLIRFLLLLTLAFTHRMKYFLPLILLLLLLRFLPWTLTSDVSLLHLHLFMKSYNNHLLTIWQMFPPLLKIGTNLMHRNHLYYFLQFCHHDSCLHCIQN
jgi:hypothetical protein